VARDIAKTEAYVTSRRERKKIEMLFAHLKRILRLDRLRLGGPYGADPAPRPNACLSTQQSTRACLLAPSRTVGLPTSSTQSARSGRSGILFGESKTAETTQLERSKLRKT